MKVLLLNPNWALTEDPLPVDTVTPPAAPPIEFGYIASSAAAVDDCQVSCLDAYAANASLARLCQIVKSKDLDHIVITTAPSLLYWRCPPLELSVPRQAITALRTATHAQITLIGPHGTVSPSWTIESTGADTVFRGSPELMLLASLKNDDRNCGRFIATKGRDAAIAAVSAKQLPVVDFSIFDWSLNYQPHMWSVNIESVFGSRHLLPASIVEHSRGCPYQCFYCFKAPLRDTYQVRPLSVIAEELSGGPDSLNRISASISGASAAVMLPRGAAAR